MPKKNKKKGGGGGGAAAVSNSCYRFDSTKCFANRTGWNLAIVCGVEKACQSIICLAQVVLPDC